MSNTEIKSNLIYSNFSKKNITITITTLNNITPDLSISDFNVVGGVLSNLIKTNGKENEYTMSFTSESSAGTKIVFIEVGKILNTDKLTNTFAQLKWVVSNPTASIISGNVNSDFITSTPNIPVTIMLNRISTQSGTGHTNTFTTNNIVANGGTIGNFVKSTNGKVYTATFTSDGKSGMKSISIPKDSIGDSVGNFNTEPIQFNWLLINSGYKSINIPKNTFLNALKRVSSENINIKAVIRDTAFNSRNSNNLSTIISNQKNPTITTKIPIHNSVITSITSLIALTFDKHMNKSITNNGFITITKGTNEILKVNTTDTNNNVIINENKIYIYFPQVTETNFFNGDIIKVNIDNGYFIDIYGNNFPGISDYQFTTIDKTPAIPFSFTLEAYGGTVVTSYFNSTNKGINFKIPVPNDNTLISGSGGYIKIKVQVNNIGGFTDLDTGTTIVAGDLGKEKTISIEKSNITSLSSINSSIENTLIFKVEMADANNNIRMSNNNITLKLDISKLIIERTTPLNQTLVSIPPNIVLEFNKNITWSGGNIVIKDKTNTTNKDITIGLPSYHSETNKITIPTPNNVITWINNHTYQVYLSGGIIKDIPGNNYGGFNDKNPYIFTIEKAKVAPSIVSHFPVNNSTGVDTDTNIILTFNSDIKFIKMPTNSNITINSPDASYDNKHNSLHDTNLENFISISGKSLIFNFSGSNWRNKNNNTTTSWLLNGEIGNNGLDYGQKYKLTIDNNLISDLDGNIFPGLTDYQFTIKSESSSKTVSGALLSMKRLQNWNREIIYDKGSEIGAIDDWVIGGWSFSRSFPTVMTQEDYTKVHIPDLMEDNKEVWFNNFNRRVENVNSDGILSTLKDSKECTFTSTKNSDRYTQLTLTISGGGSKSEHTLECMIAPILGYLYPHRTSNSPYWGGNVKYHTNEFCYTDFSFNRPIRVRNYDYFFYKWTDGTGTWKYTLELEKIGEHGSKQEMKKYSSSAASFTYASRRGNALYTKNDSPGDAVTHDLLGNAPNNMFRIDALKLGSVPYISPNATPDLTQYNIDGTLHTDNPGGTKISIDNIKTDEFINNVKPDDSIKCSVQLSNPVKDISSPGGDGFSKKIRFKYEQTVGSSVSDGIRRLYLIRMKADIKPPPNMPTVNYTGTNNSNGFVVSDIYYLKNNIIEATFTSINTGPVDYHNINDWGYSPNLNSTSINVTDNVTSDGLRNYYKNIPEFSVPVGDSQDQKTVTKKIIFPTSLYDIPVNNMQVSIMDQFNICSVLRNNKQIVIYPNSPELFNISFYKMITSQIGQPRLFFANNPPPTDSFMFAINGGSVVTHMMGDDTFTIDTTNCDDREKNFMISKGMYLYTRNMKSILIKEVNLVDKTYTITLNSIPPSKISLPIRFYTNYIKSGKTISLTFESKRVITKLKGNTVKYSDEISLTEASPLLKDLTKWNDTTNLTDYSLYGNNISYGTHIKSINGKSSKPFTINGTTDKIKVNKKSVDTTSNKDLMLVSGEQKIHPPNILLSIGGTIVTTNESKASYTDATKSWEYTYTTSNNNNNGIIAFNIYGITDYAGNQSRTVSLTSDGIDMYFDKTIPDKPKIEGPSHFLASEKIYFNINTSENTYPRIYQLNETNQVYTDVTKDFSFNNIGSENIRATYNLSMSRGEKKIFYTEITNFAGSKSVKSDAHSVEVYNFPIILTYKPEKNSKGVKDTDDFIFTFNMSIKKKTGNITFIPNNAIYSDTFNQDIDNSIKIPISNSSVTITGKNSNILTILHPHNFLKDGRLYRVIMDNSILESTIGDLSFQGINNDTYQFTVMDTTPPSAFTPTFVYPTNGYYNIQDNTNKKQLEISIPIANDKSLIDGKIKLQGKVITDSDYTELQFTKQGGGVLSNELKITSPDINNPIKIQVSNDSFVRIPNLGNNNTVQLLITIYDNAVIKTGALTNNFKTAQVSFIYDISPFNITKLYPDNNALNQSNTTYLELTFNKNIKINSQAPSTIMSLVPNLTGIATITINLSNNPTKITITDKKIKIQPDSFSTNGVDYSVKLPSGVITDMAGNPFEGFSTD